MYSAKARSPQGVPAERGQGRGLGAVAAHVADDNAPRLSGQAEQVIGHGYERFQAFITCIFFSCSAAMATCWRVYSCFDASICRIFSASSGA